MLVDDRQQSREFDCIRSPNRMPRPNAVCRLTVFMRAASRVINRGVPGAKSVSLTDLSLRKSLRRLATRLGASHRRGILHVSAFADVIASLFIMMPRGIAPAAIIRHEISIARRR